MKVVAVKNTSGCLVDSPPDSCLVTDPSEKVSANQIYFRRASPSSTPQYKNQYIIVADTNNHCIRLLDLAKEVVVTIAGKCGESNGFIDGPLGNNKLNSPTALGLDESGHIWIYDKGNRYIRVLQLDPTQANWEKKGILVTMLQGVCNDMPSQIQ